MGNRWFGSVIVAALVAVIAAGCVGPPPPPPQERTGDGTYYIGSSAGNCSYAAGETMYAAMNHVDYANSAVCGAFVKVTGPKGQVTVKITDQCPECASGDIDFSPEAFDLIANRVDGRVPISWHVVSGGNIGNIQYVVKDGSNQWWTAIQPRNHRNPVTKLEVLVGGTYQTLVRQDYNYFLASSGLGVGPYTIRLTDTYGEQLVTSGITLSPDVVQPTTVQFAAH